MSLRPSERAEGRRNRYKVGVDTEEGRRRREDNLVEIRKSKREESLMKKRRHDLLAPQDPILDSATSFVDHTNMDLLAMVAGIWSDDPSWQLESASQFNMILSDENPPIDEVIESGVLARVVEFLKRDDSPWLQFQAAWILTNIASGTWEHTKVVTDHGAIPVFIKLIDSPDDDVREHVVLALGNVAAISTHFRDFVLQCGAFTPLLAQLNDHSKLSMLRNCVWTLSNFCRGKPPPALQHVKLALSALERLIYSNDIFILKDACWALSHLSEGREEEIQNVIEAGVVPRLVELLQLHTSPVVLTPVLRTIGNLVSGNTQQTQCVINSGALTSLANLLTRNCMKSLKKEACWAVSNITTGTEEQVQSVIDANLIPILVQLAQNAEFDIKREALWAISNATTCGSHDQIKYLVEQSCIKPLCDILVCSDLKIILVCLDGLENILKVGLAEKNKGHLNYSQLIEDAEGLEKIENLQRKDNNEIYEKAVKILETYWVEEEEPAGDFHLGFGKNQVPGGFNFFFRMKRI